MPHKRSNSQFFGSLVEDEFAEVFVIYKNGLRVPFKEADFEEAKLLGKGQQGTVYAAEVIFVDNGVEEKKLCALKTLPIKKATTHKSHHKIITAAQTSSVDDNALKLMAILENDDQESFALLPYCELFLTDITKIFHEHDLEKFSKIQIGFILHVMRDLLFALEKMHEKGFSHSDIKLENIAYHAGHFCLIDLDCAQLLDEPVETISGSPFFMHPACFSDVNFCAKSENDIYALGMVLKILLKDENTKEWMQNYTELESSSLLRSISSEQSEKWGQATKNIEDKPTPLEKKLLPCDSVAKKLAIIADAMTDIRVNPDDQKHQPSLKELTSSLNTLKEEYLSTHHLSEENFNTGLTRLYEELMTKKTPLVSPDDNALPSPNAARYHGSLFKPHVDSFRSNRSNLENTSPDNTDWISHFKMDSDTIK